MPGKEKNKRNKDAEASGESVPAKSSVRIDHVFVSSGSKKFKLRLPKLASKPLLPILATVLVIAGGGATVYKYMQSKETKPPTAEYEDPINELSYRLQLLENDDYKATYADYMILGNEYLYRKDYENAEEQYKSAEAMEPNNFNVVYALANVYRLLKAKEKSLEYYNKAISLASKKEGDNQQSLELYKSERQAVENEDFDLKRVEYPSEMPL